MVIILFMSFTGWYKFYNTSIELENLELRTSKLVYTQNELQTEIKHLHLVIDDFYEEFEKKAPLYKEFC